MRKPFVIAEAGCNHGGDMKLAKRLIHEAHRCDADAIKFQAYVTEKINDKNLHSFLERCRLNKEMLLELKEEAEDFGLTFFCSVFDTESVLLMEDIGCKLVKIPSGIMLDDEVVNLVNKSSITHVILSTGMCKISEVMHAYSLLFKDCVVLMHCVSAYPCEPENANINILNLYKTIVKNGDKVGYSDHSMCLDVAIAAIAQGAVDFIEHHLSLEEQVDSDGPDMKVSYSPFLFSLWVKALRRAYKCLGSGVKDILACEKEMTHRRKKNLKNK